MFAHDDCSHRALINNPSTNKVQRRLAFTADVKASLLCTLFVLGLLIRARCEQSSWANIECLLGKSVASEEVSRFVEMNHLNRYSVTNASAVVTAFVNSKKSPFVLVCDNNMVDEVQVTLWKYME